MRWGKIKDLKEKENENWKISYRTNCGIGCRGVGRLREQTGGAGKVGKKCGD
jgi:hypothetical protein